MEEPPSPAEGVNTYTFIVICAGCLAGSVVQGLTGFGKAILLVLVWVLAKFFGDAGPLATVVITDSLTSIVLAVPYFIMTKAMKTADGRLVTTLYLSRSVSAPLGALALVVLNKRITELAMALVLLALVLMSVDCTALLTRLKRKRSFPLPQKKAEGLQDTLSSASHDQLYLPLNPSLRSVSSFRSDHQSELSMGSVYQLHADASSSCASPTAMSVSTPFDVNCSLQSDQLQGKQLDAETHGVQHEGGLELLGDDGVNVDLPQQTTFMDSALAVNGFDNSEQCRHVEQPYDDGYDQLQLLMPDRPHQADGVDATDSSLQQPTAPQLAVAGHQITKSAGQTSKQGCSTHGMSRSDGGVHHHRPALSRLSLCTRGMVAEWDSQQQLPESEVHNCTQVHDPRQASEADLSSMQPLGQQQQQQEQWPQGQQQGQDSRPATQGAPQKGTATAEDQKEAGAVQDHEDVDDSTMRLLPADAEGGSCSGSGMPAGSSSLRRLYIQARLFLYDKANQRMLMLGSLCGAAAGLLEGLLGVGGPPIMYLYAKLNTPQDVARGTNGMMGVLGIFSLRILAYWMLGVYQKADIPLYCTASVLSLGGMALGLFLCKFVNQKGFKTCLLVLMCICCTLMFLSAAGLAG